MKQLTITLDDATFQTAEQRAQKTGKSLTTMFVEFLGSLGTSNESDFERLAREEEVLRANLREQGRRFSAQDRLTRDELHDRHALH